MSALGAKLEKLLDIKTSISRIWEEKKRYAKGKLPTLLRQQHTGLVYFWNKARNHCSGTRKVVVESWSWKHRLSDRLSERIVQGMAMIGPESNKMLWVNFSSFFNANQILLFQLCLSVYLHSGKSASRFEKESEVPQSFLFDFRIFCQIQCEAVERVVHPLHEHMSVI